MKKKTKVLWLSMTIALLSSMTVFAEQSARWVGEGDRWQVSDQNGGYIKNDWFQDDVTGHWYLLGAEDGTVMYAGLVTDQETGKSYLLNPEHDGTYGRMLSVNGIYRLNGHYIKLTFNQNHDGAFGAITSNVDAVRSTGISEKKINPSDPASNETEHNQSVPEQQNTYNSVVDDIRRFTDKQAEEWLSEVDWSTGTSTGSDGKDWIWH